MSVTIKSKTVDVIDDFKKIVNGYAQKKTADPNEILSNLRRIRTTNPPIFQDAQIAKFLKARSKAVKSLLDSYIVAKLTQNYGLIDRKLYSFNRHVLVEENKI